MATQRLTSRRRQDQGSKWVRIVMAVLATVGVIDTGSITLKFWGVLGDLTCPMGAGGCDKVLNSPWGTLFQGDGFSIPLSFAGLDRLSRSPGHGGCAFAPRAVGEQS
jgi:uncharacterized membrane protein